MEYIKHTPNNFILKMTNTVTTMKREPTLGLERKIAEAPKRKTSYLIVGGLAAIALAAAGIGITYYGNKPEESAKPAAVAVQIQSTEPKKLEYITIQAEVPPEAQSHLKSAYDFIKEKYDFEKEDVMLYSCGHITRKPDWNRITVTGDFGYNFIFLHKDAHLGLTVDEKGKASDDFYFALGEKEKKIIKALEDAIWDGIPLAVMNVKQVRKDNIFPFDIVGYSQPVTDEVYKIDCLRIYVKWKDKVSKAGGNPHEEYYFDFGARIIVGHDSSL